eukprot:m51a1_g1076 hypothetical protein (418) ;mRNA; f:5926-7646
MAQPDACAEVRAAHLRVESLLSTPNPSPWPALCAAASAPPPAPPRPPCAASYVRMPPLESFVGLAAAPAAPAACCSRPEALAELARAADGGGPVVLCGVVESSRAYGVLGLVHTSQMEGRCVEDFQEGDAVRVAVVGVNVESERISLSFRVPEAEGPHDAELSEQTATYDEVLMSDRQYLNPNALEQLVQSLGLEEDASFLPDDALPSDWHYDVLHAKQNRKWAQETVVKGVELAKKGDYQKAMVCYKQAIEVDPQNADAYVARGAAYANQDKLHEAVREFERALEIDPSFPNALNKADKDQREKRLIEMLEDDERQRAHKKEKRERSHSHRHRSKHGHKHKHRHSHHRKHRHSSPSSSSSGSESDASASAAEHASTEGKHEGRGRSRDSPSHAERKRRHSSRSPGAERTPDLKRQR